MKNIITIILCSLSFLSCAQQVVDINTFNEGSNTGKYFKDIPNNSQNFVGVWRNTTGNMTFEITLYKTSMKPMGYPIDYYIDAIEGRFRIVKDLGAPNEQTIHSSIKQYPTTTTLNVIFGVTYDGINMGGNIMDNCASGGDEIITGFYTMTIQNSGGNITAHWKMKPGSLLEGDYYSVPMDAILTKVQ